MYKQVRDYRAHMTSHSNSANLQCDVCNVVLPSIEQYIAHLSQVKCKFIAQEKAQFPGV